MTTAPELPYGATDPVSALPAEDFPPPHLTLIPGQLAAVPLADEPLDFEDALGRAKPRLLRYATRRLGDAHEAEEIVQEAMLRAFQHRDVFATDDDLMAWLTVVSGRLVIDRVRVRGRSVPVAEMPLGGRAGRDTADVVVGRDEARMALDALEAMPSRQAAVLWAREIEGLSYDELADRFEMSEPTVRSLLHRARKTLRREYALRGGTLPTAGLIVLAPWLRGLRAASRLRTAVSKPALSVAALATLGMAAIAVAPFTHVLPGHSVTPAPPSVNATVERAVTPARSHAVTKVATQSRTTTTAAHVAAPTATTQHSTTLPIAPRMCAGSVTVNCVPHDSPMLWVKLPVAVAGTDGVGVSSTSVDCTTLMLATSTDPICTPAQTSEKSR